MAQSVLQGDYFVNGTFYASSMLIATNSIGDSQVQAGANIAATKLESRRNVSYSQDSTTDATVEIKTVLVVNGATGTIISFGVGAVTPAAAAGNAVVDLLKNGSTILSSTITLDSGTAAYALKTPAGFTSTALAQGDVLAVKVTSAAATKPKGLFFRLVLDEKAA